MIPNNNATTGGEMKPGKWFLSYFSSLMPPEHLTSVGAHSFGASLLFIWGFKRARWHMNGRTLVLMELANKLLVWKQYNNTLHWPGGNINDNLLEV